MCQWVYPDLPAVTVVWAVALISSYLAGQGQGSQHAEHQLHLLTLVVSQQQVVVAAVAVDNVPGIHDVLSLQLQLLSLSLS